MDAHLSTSYTDVLLVCCSAHVLPYTGVMFLIGTLIGIGVELHKGTTNQLNESVRQWVSINAEVLLLSMSFVISVNEG